MSEITCPFCQRVYHPKEEKGRYKGYGEWTEVTVWRDENGGKCQHFLAQRRLVHWSEPRCAAIGGVTGTITDYRVEGLIIFSADVAANMENEHLLAVTETGRQFVWERD